MDTLSFSFSIVDFTKNFDFIALGLYISGCNLAHPGRIDAGDLLVALRALGFEPRKDEVKKLMSDNDKENTGTINKAQFVEIFKAKWVGSTIHFGFMVTANSKCRHKYDTC